MNETDLLPGNFFCSYIQKSFGQLITVPLNSAYDNNVNYLQYRSIYENKAVFCHDTMIMIILFVYFY